MLGFSNNMTYEKRSELRKECSKFLKFAEDQVNPRYILMDPLGKEEGIFNNKWKLRLNISENEICSICNKQY